MFNAPIMAHAQWAVDIRSVDRGESIFSLNAGKLMMPASNMKILTLAAAAEVLGWDARMTTTLEASAPVVDGILRGDLFVRGGGDPTINTRDGRGDAVFVRMGERAEVRRHHVRSTAASSATIRRSTTRDSAAAGRGTIFSTGTRRRSARCSSTRTLPSWW